MMMTYYVRGGLLLRYLVSPICLLRPSCLAHFQKGILPLLESIQVVKGASKVHTKLFFRFILTNRAPRSRETFSKKVFPSDSAV